MKIIHTKDGRTLYKDDQGHWLKKGDAEKRLSSDVRDPDKEEQIAKAQKEADKLNGKSAEMTQEEFNERAKKIQQQYIGMDVKTFVEGLNSKNINEKLGIEATDQQKWELIRLFKLVAEHQHSYDENHSPKVFDTFSISQNSLLDPSEHLSANWRKTISIFFSVKGNTGRALVDMLDEKYSHSFMGMKGGLFTFIDSKKVRIDALDAAFGSDWIESKYGKKKGKKSE